MSKSIKNTKLSTKLNKAWEEDNARRALKTVAWILNLSCLISAAVLFPLDEIFLVFVIIVILPLLVIASVTGLGWGVVEAFLLLLQWKDKKDFLKQINKKAKKQP
jgi:hypothetical protein